MRKSDSSSRRCGTAFPDFFRVRSPTFSLFVLVPFPLRTPARPIMRCTPLLLCVFLGQGSGDAFVSFLWRRLLTHEVSQFVLEFSTIILVQQFPLSLLKLVPLLACQVFVPTRSFCSQSFTSRQSSMSLPDFSAQAMTFVVSVVSLRRLHCILVVIRLFVLSQILHPFIQSWYLSSFRVGITALSNDWQLHQHLHQKSLACQVMDVSVKRASAPQMRALTVPSLHFLVRFNILIFHPRVYIGPPLVPPIGTTRAIAAMADLVTTL